LADGWLGSRASSAFYMWCLVAAFMLACAVGALPHLARCDMWLFSA